MEEAIMKFVKEIMRSDAYMTWQAEKRSIEKHTEWKREVMAFDMLQQQVYKKNPTQQDIARLSGEYERLNKVPDIARYFAASEHFADFLNAITKRMTELCYKNV